MRVLVLGSAAGGGFPQWNCNTAACNRARAGDLVAAARTQSSLAVSADGEAWFLLNASPDLRQQINDTPPLHPKRGLRHSPIAGVVLTNGDVDHVAGLLTLREGHAFALYATARVLRTLKENSIFNVLAADLVPRRTLTLETPTRLAHADGTDAGIEIEPFAVPGKVALYLEDSAAGENFGTVAEDTVGLKVTSAADGRSFFYLPGCAAMTEALAARLDGAPLVFFDGTLWRDDEMIAAGVGTKTGRRMGHMSMSGPDGSIAAFADIRIGRKVFIHMNNTNPVLLADSAERAEAEAAGWDIAHDGMEIRL
jgi:pyrroloquinoline quinone biosynthesis protein B